MKQVLLATSLCFSLFAGMVIRYPSFVFAQQPSPSTVSQRSSEKTAFDDITKPESEQEKKTIVALFAKRPADKLTYYNFTAYLVQYGFKIGVPANTIILILLLPLLATIVAFARHVIGLPNLGMLVAISFSITILTIGITAGMIILAAIILASTFARIILKKIRIMQLPKMALSVFMVSLFVFVALVGSRSLGIISVSDLSIFPVLLLILLGERIVALQLERSVRETIIITMITLLLGILGFFLLSFVPLRHTVLLYPEIITLLIPINILIGRYFGLRLTEYFRFKKILRYGSK